MTEQAGHNPRSEQTQNGERKGAEKDFATQVQERVQSLAEHSPDTELLREFGLIFDGESTPFGVAVKKKLSPGDRTVMFNYGSVRGSLGIKNGEVQDILSYTYSNPEAHLIDWGKIAEDDEADDSIQLIAKRMQQLVSNPEDVKPIDKARVDMIADSIWNTAQELHFPTIYSFFEDFSTPIGNVSVHALSDMAVEGNYASDESKPHQSINIRTANFMYARDVIDGSVREFFDETIDTDTLPPITDEERKSHPYVVLTAEQGSPRQKDDEVTFDENGNQVELVSPTDGYTVISVDTGPGVTARFQTWHKTREEAKLMLIYSMPKSLLDNAPIQKILPLKDKSESLMHSMQPG